MLGPQQEQQALLITVPSLQPLSLDFYLSAGDLNLGPHVCAQAFADRAIAAPMFKLSLVWEAHTAA